jgi:hypothetical protein
MYTTEMAAQLTDEQADFVTNLHRDNVPASAIARVVDRMLRDGRSRVVGERLVDDDVERQAPPSCDFHGKAE